MKTKMKMVLYLMLVLVMVFSFVACTKDAATPDDSGKEVETSEVSEGTTVSLIVWNEPMEDKEMDWYYQCEQATGIGVDVTVIPDTEYSSKLNQMVATKADADIMIVWENDIANFAQAGGILSLDDYLADSSIEQGDFIEAVASLSDGLGATYGLPWCAATEILYYNQGMFDAAGINYPNNDWSYEEFLAAAEALTQYNEDGSTSVYGCALPNAQTWWAGVGAAGDLIYDSSSGQLVIGDGAVSFLQSSKDMVDAGIMPEPSSDTADLFSSGQAAMSWQGSWMIGVYGGNLDFNWDIATLPTDEIKYNTLHTGFFTISSTCKDPDAAWKVIEYMMSEEGQGINSKASGNPSALLSIAAKEEWKVESATTIDNWEAMTDSLASGVFGYTCIPSGVTNNAIGLFNSVLLGQNTPKEAVDQAMEYAAETIG